MNVCQSYVYTLKRIMMIYVKFCEKKNKPFVHINVDHFKTIVLNK